MQIELRHCMRIGIAALALAGMATMAHAQKEIKIGVIFDYTGPFAAGGSQAAAIGTKIAIDMINEKGGVEGHNVITSYSIHYTKLYEKARFPSPIARWASTTA